MVVLNLAVTYGAIWLAVFLFVRFDRRRLTRAALVHVGLFTGLLAVEFPSAVGSVRDEKAPTFGWQVDSTLTRRLERTRLGRRVLSTDRHAWSTGWIVHAFRGQWNIEELFRRAKKGGVVPWGPSHRWADGSLRLHTFSTVLGLTLVSHKDRSWNGFSVRAMMESLGDIRATLVRRTTGGSGRRPTVMLPPELTSQQRCAVKALELDRWFPTLLSCVTAQSVRSWFAGTCGRESPIVLATARK